MGKSLNAIRKRKGRENEKIEIERMRKVVRFQTTENSKTPKRPAPREEYDGVGWGGGGPDPIGSGRGTHKVGISVCFGVKSPNRPNREGYIPPRDRTYRRQWANADNGEGEERGMERAIITAKTQEEKEAAEKAKGKCTRIAKPLPGNDYPQVKNAMKIEISRLRTDRK